MSESYVPGEIVFGEGRIAYNENRVITTVEVLNTGDRPIQVGSHFHFAEVNEFLEFDRVAARGQRLAIPAGTSVRFEPGTNRRIDLVPYVGNRYVAGFTGSIAGELDA